jgi:chromosome segregation and condensation protein ScpB
MRQFEETAGLLLEVVEAYLRYDNGADARRAIERRLYSAHESGRAWAAEELAALKVLRAEKAGSAAERKTLTAALDAAQAEVEQLRREINGKCKHILALSAHIDVTREERKEISDVLGADLYSPGNVVGLIRSLQADAELRRSELAAAQDEIAATAARLAEVTQDLEGQRKHSQFLEGHVSSLCLEKKTLNADRKEMIDAVIDALGDDLCCLGDVVASIRALRKEVQTSKSAIENLQANYDRACKETQDARRQRDQESARLREFHGFARAIGSIAGILGSRAALEPSGAVEAVAKLFTDARALRANRDALARDLQAVGDALGGDILFSGDVPASVRLLRERLSSEGVQAVADENARLKREIDDARDRLAQVTQIACLAPVSRKPGGDMDA